MCTCSMFFVNNDLVVENFDFLFFTKTTSMLSSVLARKWATIYQIKQIAKLIYENRMLRNIIDLRE